MTKQQLNSFWEKLNSKVNTLIGKATVPAMRSGDPLAKEVHKDLIELGIWIDDTLGPIIEGRTDAK